MSRMPYGAFVGPASRLDPARKRALAPLADAPNRQSPPSSAPSPPKSPTPKTRPATPAPPPGYAGTAARLRVAAAVFGA